MGDGVVCNGTVQCMRRAFERCIPREKRLRNGVARYSGSCLIAVAIVIALSAADDVSLSTCAFNMRLPYIEAVTVVRALSTGFNNRTH